MCRQITSYNICALNIIIKHPYTARLSDGSILTYLLNHIWHNTNIHNTRHIQKVGCHLWGQAYHTTQDPLDATDRRRVHPPLFVSTSYLDIGVLVWLNPVDTKLSWSYILFVGTLEI